MTKHYMLYCFKKEKKKRVTNYLFDKYIQFDIQNTLIVLESNTTSKGIVF